MVRALAEQLDARVAMADDDSLAFELVFSDPAVTQTTEASVQLNSVLPGSLKILSTT